jgi:hypothetical protein
MNKKAIIIAICGIALALLSATDLFNEKILPVQITVTVFLCGILVAFAGPAVAVFSLAEQRRKRIASGALILSFALIFIGSVCVKLHLPGARVEIILGALILCFFYGTLAFRNKYEKWRIYTRSNRDAFFLSLFDFLGIAALVLGLLFKVQHWPMAEGMMIIGLIVLAIGTFSWNQKFKNEVVFRKETEDKLKESLVEIEAQHQKLEEKQKEIIDSITYAKRIQSSLLPTETYIDNSLKRLNKK